MLAGQYNSRTHAVLDNALSPPATNYTVTGLLPFTQYEFQVLSQNDISKAASNWVTVRTLEAGECRVLWIFSKANAWCSYAVYSVVVFSLQLVKGSLLYSWWELSAVVWSWGLNSKLENSELLHLVTTNWKKFVVKYLIWIAWSAQLRF